MYYLVLKDRFGGANFSVYNNLADAIASALQFPYLNAMIRISGINNVVFYQIGL